MVETLERVIDDLNAPERLRGLTLTVAVDTDIRRMDFLINMPDDATNQEIGYFKWFVGEIVEELEGVCPIIFTKNAATEPLLKVEGPIIRH